MGERKPEPKSEPERESRFEQVHKQMLKLEAEGKKDEAKSLLKSFLETTQELTPQQKKDATVVRNIKIKTKRAIYLDGKIVLEGNVVLASEEEAKEFCDRGFDGYHPFYGYAPEMAGMVDEDGQPVARHLMRQKIVRAVRVA